MHAWKIDMANSLLPTWLKSLRPNTYFRQECDQILSAVNVIEKQVSAITDAELQARFNGLRPCADGGVLPVERLPEIFALVREACRRAVGLRPYDVQILAGIILARGHIAEMATGEGKTLTAALPASALALTGRGVHVATVNAYLAKRDHELMSPVYSLLGLTAALLPEKVGGDKKRAAYEADITYGTGYEFGFDYLRDQLQAMGRVRPQLGEEWRSQLLGNNPPEPARGVQRPFAHAVVDEVDSVLIDEATTPLIISGTPEKGENPAAALYQEANRIALELRPDHDYVVDITDHSLELSDEALQRLYTTLPDRLRPLMRRAWHEHVEQALRAHCFYKRDVHYLVRKSAIEIIDINTGRSFVDRKWRAGLHQAVEAKENVRITHETTSDVSISRQRFFRMYPLLAGMTGTAMEQQAELRSVYGLAVVPVPLHRPSKRVNYPTRVFGNTQAMIQAVIQEVKACLKRGQPVLVGTRSVQRSDEVAAALHAEGIEVVLLNARQDEAEAEIIACAGRAGRVTIATNMAGRGADIPLGPGVAENGGLHVIGVEFNDARRINRQLIGRCARQGEPGSSQFFVAWDDTLATRMFPQRRHMDGECEAGEVRHFHKAMLRAEREAYRIRCRVMEHDKWLDNLKRHI